ncbi:hypothetical protein O3M35_011617 [Rhynocoris fuscipes]|uniref:Carboxylesterase type B domain-containing protein n=1 Tax=Rhynocoris fuscipes TaxID=488301 RepID=A0AAW1CXC4_9HEMI
MRKMLLVLLLMFGSCTAVIVDTKYGQVKGYPFTTRNQRQVLSFSGIPYATPPLGSLRFKDPEPPKPYDGVIDRNVSTECPYYTIPGGILVGDEDCLQLAVYTPSLNSSKLYPVLVYIHGGGWAFFSGESTYGAQYFMDYDMVVVEIEYRQGILGMLSLENNIIPGNMALKDQVLALKWVQENIAAFKGDPKRITLIGHSSGSSSVNYHMISPLSRGLFHATIFISGVAIAPWGLSAPGSAKQLALKIASLLNCSTINYNELLVCLQGKNVSDLLSVFQKDDFPLFGKNPFLILVPVIDNYSKQPFLPENPHLMTIAPVPLFAGVNNLDGFLFSECNSDCQQYVPAME